MPEPVILGSEHRDEWNAFAASCPGGDVLQSWEWGELKGRGEWIPIRLALREGNEIVAGMSLLKRALPIPGKSFLYASRGPLLREWTPERLHDLLAAAKDVARKHGAIFLKVDPALTDPRIAEMLRKEGFHAAGGEDGFGGTQPRCVMTLDLHPSEDEIFNNFHQKWRYNTRLAERKGITVKTDCAKDDLRTFYDLLKVTCERDGFLVRSYSYFEDMWDLLVPRGMGKLFLTYFEDQPLGGSFNTIFGPTFTYTYGASSNEHRNKMPNHLMQWTMIRWAKANGCTLYDFRGVSPRHVDPEHDKLAGLNQFKAGFGAEFVEYVGEFDLPLSPMLYRAWTKGMPMVRDMMKRRRRAVSKEPAAAE
ncbi:MAG: peptidoglycan bridge formation glycyltransferase FemA/FemB family protein [Armatimonadetes bacterium]|nr:peptidoglycan bridge formation glycyltransferase FemA/FemB family protein [Armatimonadota bacterium]